jgi:hypothetical protein
VNGQKKRGERQKHIDNLAIVIDQVKAAEQAENFKVALKCIGKAHLLLERILKFLDAYQFRIKFEQVRGKLAELKKRN